MTSKTEPDEASEPQHVLRIADKSFVCSDKLSIAWLIRHADDAWNAYAHAFLTKVVAQEDQDEMWEAFEDLDDDEALGAVDALAFTYSGQAQGKP